MVVCFYGMLTAAALNNGRDGNHSAVSAIPESVWETCESSTTSQTRQTRSDRR
jgi:hypothetical protein